MKLRSFVPSIVDLDKIRAVACVGDHLLLIRNIRSPNMSRIRNRSTLDLETCLASKDDRSDALPKPCVSALVLQASKTPCPGHLDSSVAQRSCRCNQEIQGMSLLVMSAIGERVIAVDMRRLVSAALIRDTAALVGDSNRNRQMRMEEVQDGWDRMLRSSC